LYQWDATVTCPAASRVPTIPALNDEHVRNLGGMISGKEKQALGEKTSPRTNLSNTNNTKAMLGTNLSFCGQKAMNSLGLNAFYILHM